MISVRQNKAENRGWGDYVDRVITLKT